MISLMLRSFPSVIHLGLTLIYIEVILRTDENKFGLIIATGLLLLITINTVTTSVVSKGQWRQLFISLVSFIFILFLYCMYLVLVGDPGREVDDNPGAGFFILIGLSLSFISILLGTSMGIAVINLRNQIKKFYKEP